MKSPMNSLRRPPGTPTTRRQFQSVGRRRTQRALATSVMAPVTWSPGRVRSGSIGVRQEDQMSQPWICAKCDEPILKNQRFTTAIVPGRRSNPDVVSGKVLVHKNEEDCKKR